MEKQVIVQFLVVFLVVMLIVTAASSRFEMVIKVHTCYFDAIKSIFNIFESISAFLLEVLTTLYCHIGDILATLFGFFSHFFTYFLHLFSFILPVPIVLLLIVIVGLLFLVVSLPSFFRA